MPRAREPCGPLAQLCAACNAARVPDLRRRDPSSPLGATPDADHERRLAAAWSSLLDRTDEIGDALALKLLATEPIYAQAGPDMHAELRASCREHVQRGVRTMAGLAAPGEEAVHVWRETGRRRARQGIPMDAVVRAYSLGCRTLWECLLERWEQGDVEVDEHLLLLAGQGIWRSMDVQTATLVESYRREHARLQLRDMQRQHSLLDGLVEGRGTDPAFAQEVCEGLGLAGDAPLVCVVAPIDDPSTEPLHAPADQLERCGIDSHWHVRADTYFGVVALGSRTVDQLWAVLEPRVDGRVALVSVPEGVAGFASAYRLALRAADTLPEGSSQLTTLEQRLPEVLLAGSPDVVPPLLRESLGPVFALPPQQSSMLLDTLAAVLAHDGSPTHAARALFCHRNTVIYRMHRLESLTGRRIAEPRDKLLLSLGVLATGRAL